MPALARPTPEWLNRCCTSARPQRGERIILIGRAAVHNVASISRAARSGDSAMVIGRPTTRIDAPASSA